MLVPLLAGLLSLQIVPVMAAGQAKVNVSLSGGALTDVFAAIERQSDYRFLYSSSDVNGVWVDRIDLRDQEVEQVLRQVLRGTGLTWGIDENVISIKAAPAQQEPPARNNTITGRVLTEAGNPLPSVSVTIKGTSQGVLSNIDGSFVLVTTRPLPITLVFSFMGMEAQEHIWRGERMNIVMHESVMQSGQVVVTGLYTRARESFAGSFATYSAQELKSVGNQNILQSLKTIDPAFIMLDNSRFGSDPNTLPEIEINGATSIKMVSEEYGTYNPNQPLFIVDGFESTLQYVMDMSMDRVESITILKDAASTAIYGSKAANGVIVIETRRPQNGKLQLSYNGNLSINMPDLSDYNLMNSREKLEFERLSGRWGLNGMMSDDMEVAYMRHLKDIESGVDTYWLAEPVRVGLTQRHSLYADGGQNEVTYGIGLTYGKTQGVMKGSGRDAVNGNLALSYRIGKLNFRNRLNIDNVSSDREKVEFSRFALMNPYFRKSDENGNPNEDYD